MNDSRHDPSRILSVIRRSHGEFFSQAFGGGAYLAQNRAVTAAFGRARGAVLTPTVSNPLETRLKFLLGGKTIVLEEKIE